MAEDETTPDQPAEPEDQPESEVETLAEEKPGYKKRKHRRKPSKRHVGNSSKIDRLGAYPVSEAVQLLKSSESTKFDETVEIALKLGIDPKQSDQQVRGTVILPKGTGKTVSVLVFAEGPKATEAEEAGADYVGSKDLADKILKESWMEFDVALATPDMMKHVGRLGKVLGPHGKMPSPKAGTLTMDIGQAVKEFKAGKIEYRNDKLGGLSCPIGKKSFSAEDLEANLNAVIDHLQSIRPATTKGLFIKRAFLSSTMGPGIPLAVIG